VVAKAVKEAAPAERVKHAVEFGFEHTIVNGLSTIVPHRLQNIFPVLTSGFVDGEANA